MSIAADHVSGELDPITFEVLRHRLDEIVAEAYHTIGRVSGSPIVYEGGDHQEALCTARGELLACGAGALHWIRSIPQGIGHVRERFADNPGFYDGDQFIVNDPYVAAVHASDLQVLAPIFWEGEIIAWAGTASHQQDTGGINPGGHHVSATDVYAEGFQTAGLKLVEAGVIRSDIEQTLGNLIRQPELGLLDVHAKIASNNVMRARVVGLVQRYGLGTVLALFDQVISYSERQLRRRLEEIEDGAWTATSHVEAIAEQTLSVALELRKRGDTLTFDFTGSSPQSVAAENITAPGVVGGAMCPVLMALCHDLPFNEGLFRPVDFVLPEGSIVNPIRPAAVSANVPSGGLTLVSTSAQIALGKMLSSTPALREEAAGVVGATFNFPVFAGRDQHGAPFASLILDGLAGGLGARDGADGDSTGHAAWAVKTMIPNVETTELLYPLLYLWRRQVTDSAGAGQFRGGAGMDVGIAPRAVSELELVTVGVGTESRAALGLEGGLPGSNAPVLIARGALPGGVHETVELPHRPDDLAGERQRISPKGVTRLAATDVLHMYVSGGGGGFGDPLRREPDAVAEDVRRAVVSRGVAAEVYGVVVDDHSELDLPATVRRREELRAGRLSDAGTDSTAGSWTMPIGYGEPAELSPPDGLFALRFACAPDGRLTDVALVRASVDGMAA